MSNLQNDIIAEALVEKILITLDKNIDLRNALAEKLLDGYEYYLYCKEDAKHYLYDLCDDIGLELEEAYWNGGRKFKTFDELIEKTYNIKAKA